MDRCAKQVSFPSTAVAGTVLAAAVLGASGCSTPEAVDLTVSAVHRDVRLSIEGRANLPDGAWIVYVAYLETEPLHRLRGAAQMHKGVYQAERRVADWPAEPIVVDVHFQTRSEGLFQPSRVRERYGLGGGSMTGPGVIQAGEGSRVAVATTIVGRP